MKNFFEFKKLNTSFRKELIGALSTFSAMAYIIVVHPTILHEAGLPFGPIMTVTILITALSTFLMGVFGKVPLAVAPAMGVSAYFTFTLIQKNQMAVSEGLFVVFLSAITILLMNIFHLRKKILNEIPHELITGITGGIGLFLITVGLKQIGLVKVGTLGLISLNSIDPIVFLFTLSGILLIILFEKLKIKAAFILSILIIWMAANSLGYSQLNGIIDSPPSILPTLFLLKAPETLSYDFFKAFLSIFLVTLFDSSAGLLTLRKIMPKEARDFDMQKALYPDAVGSSIGAIMGTSSLAIHLESMAGIHSGARSGFSSLIVSFLFLLCLFFYPLASSIPFFASAPCIIAIGFLMAKQLKNLETSSTIEKIAPILTALVMPMTLSLYQGFKIGFISLGLISLLYPKKINRSKIILFFSGLFLLEQLLILLNQYFGI